MDDNKVILIMGPRQVGKTTFVKNLINDKKALFFNGDETETRATFSTLNASFLQRVIGDHSLIVIDEAQRIDDIGVSLKIIYDTIPDVKIIATGSSAFELANKTNEPLTGRKWEYTMYPLSFEEMANHHGFLEEKKLLHHRLVYGYYPDVVKQYGKEAEILNLLADSYLYKDILAIERIKKPKKLENLLRALAFQVGSEVSYHELGQLTDLHPSTVERYIDIFEKMFIIVGLNSYSRNLRNEIKKGRKYYFFDLGIRNSIINNFNPVNLRNDVGALWENFMILERLKYQEYHRYHCNNFFWRTHAQQEIDFIEEKDGVLYAYEMKWNSKKKPKLPKSFANAYPEHEYQVIGQDNFYDFIMK